MKKKLAVALGQEREFPVAVHNPLILHSADETGIRAQMGPIG